MIIETESLKKVYRTDAVETTAVDSINFQLSEGQFVSVMGPSGCGKSTLLHILGLIDSPTEGRYRFMGQDVSGYPERKRARLEKMDIAHRRDHFPAQLSGGQQQRVAVARALVNRPTLILADEPTGNLDSEHGDEVMKMLLKLNEEGTTILMVTHSAANASFSGRIVNLLDGKVVSDKMADR
jgi:putative ABC transport system ATP-binding protein